MMDFPQLPPAVMRPEEEQPEKEVFKMPTWQCFCCHDSGRVQPHLAQMVIPDYDHSRDRLPLCQNPDCKADYWANLDLKNADTRFTATICQKLDSYSRNDWEKSRADWFDKLKSRLDEGLQKISQSKNLRQRDRTDEEREIANYNHNDKIAWANLSDKEREALLTERGETVNAPN
jgi:hypothetical protein